MSDYRYGKSWTVSDGKFYNGAGSTIEKPAAYFSAVADNKYGYNASYTTGAGVSVEKPSAYYAAVASDKYGYTARSAGGKK